ncbi:MAG: hypothetical protein AAGC49_11190, partial [Brevundimonas sp.]
MTPAEYASLTTHEKSRWLTAARPDTPELEALVLAETDVSIRAAAAHGSHQSEAFLMRLYEGESDPQLREVIATNPSAPLVLLEAVPVGRHIGASLAAYARRARLSAAEQEALGAFVEANHQ